MSLDTLEITSDSEVEDFVLLPDGEERQNSRNLRKRAGSKYLSHALSLALVDATKANGTGMEKKYWQTYHCANNTNLIKQLDPDTGKPDNRLRTSFCKKRWCTTCNRIRTAEQINTYLSTIETWPDKHFVTLTVPNPTAEELDATLQTMLVRFRKAKDNLRKTQGIKLVGLRKLEITYNRREDTYHPHYHFIIRNEQHGKALVREWLRLNPDASERAQDCVKATDNSVFELFKYFTKLTSNSNKDKIITAKALDRIMVSIEGKRAFQPFGFTPHPEQEPQTVERNMIVIEELNYHWEHEVGDWVRKETGEPLSNFDPSRAKEISKRIR